jgi:hypothetical protein
MHQSWLHDSSAPDDSARTQEKVSTAILTTPYRRMQCWLAPVINYQPPTGMIIGEEIQIDGRAAAFRAEHGRVNIQLAFGDNI